MFSGMKYRSVVFSMHDGRPGNVEYGIQMMQGEDDRLVGVHIKQIEDSADLHENAVVRDGVFNRVLELEIKGVSMRYIRLVVSSLERTAEYEFAGYSVAAVTASANLVTQPIDILASDVRAGEIWISTVNPRFVSNAA
ncbi:hypothetical protein [Paraburkholderia domus]|uniref:hypothetical protein n=1 Tax=Paraburkholderia domus TaxID=2793075 RepID=UPI001912A4BA|nr:hypothetical protein [Paraburkholderia domus]MBK5065761.1 hypothetical protein [Burkholderia sp. R-70199]CAE6962807.1 hypothetical protein R70199_07448 [Paraburkholderia domus]